MICPQFCEGHHEENTLLEDGPQPERICQLDCAFCSVRGHGSHNLNFLLDKNVHLRQLLLSISLLKLSHGLCQW